LAHFAFLVFLSLNDVEMEADEEDFERIVLSVAQGKTDKASVAEFFRKNSRPHVA
jgi:prophage maintenance system killer protein